MMHIERVAGVQREMLLLAINTETRVIDVRPCGEVFTLNFHIEAARCRCEGLKRRRLHNGDGTRAVIRLRNRYQHGIDACDANGIVALSNCGEVHGIHTRDPDSTRRWRTCNCVLRCGCCAVVCVCCCGRSDG